MRNKRRKKQITFSTDEFSIQAPPQERKPQEAVIKKSFPLEALQTLTSCVNDHSKYYYQDNFSA